MSISASLRSVRGERQGVPKLTLDLDVESQLDVRLVIINLTAEMRVAKEMFVTDLNESYFIGTGILEPMGIMQLSQRGKGNWQVAFPLSPFQLHKMEEMRGGRDLFLQIKFFCTAGHQENVQAKIITDVSQPPVGVGGFSGGYCPFKVAQSDWEKTLKELGYQDLEEDVQRTKERAQSANREIEDILENVREAASMYGAAQHAIHFKDEADEHRNSSKTWLIATAVLGALGVAYSLWSFRQNQTIFSQGGATWWPHLAYVTSRLLVLSVVFFGMGWSAKIYRAHKHNETVNRHRQNALRTFETFAAATKEPATKDAVLLQATKSIFEPQSSGYLTGESEKVPSGTVVEVLKNVMSSRGSP